MIFTVNVILYVDVVTVWCNVKFLLLNKTYSSQITNKNLKVHNTSASATQNQSIMMNFALQLTEATVRKACINIINLVLIASIWYEVL
jgi:hypothetical protein